MKKKIISLMLGIGCLVSAFAAQPLVFIANKVYNSNPEEEYIDKGKTSHRKPSRPIECLIEESGITFYTEETPDIILYEIYDETESLVGVFGDEREFVAYLFTLQGEHKLVFSTIEYDLMGWVYL